MIARPWTDDLPKCRNTCVGQLFSRSGNSSISNEDQLCFYCNLEDNTCLYGVFEPHNGLDAARFVMQRMAAEILFQPLSENTTDEEIRDILRNSFMSVEKAYIENYDGMIAERTSLQYQYQVHNMNGTKNSIECNEILSRLKEIDQQLCSGVTVAVALTHHGRMFVANVGEARALLAKTDENLVLRVVQLSVDHSLSNEDELLRLRQIGIDVNKLRNSQYLGNQPGTRCLGNYLVKGLYKGFPEIRGATAEPVIATPEIHGPIVLDDSCRFLVLVTSVVYKRLQEIHGSYDQANKQLAQIVVEKFRKETDFQNISQSVLDVIANEFGTYCIKNALTPKSNSHMTLLIRNFNFPVPNASTPQSVQSLQSKQQNASVRFNPIVQAKSNELLDQIDSNGSSICRDDTDTEKSIVDTNRSIIDTNQSESTSDSYHSAKMYDKNKRIKGYVDFSCYYENVEKARKNGTLPSFIK